MNIGGTQRKLALQNDIMVVVCPLILLRGAPEKVNRRKSEVPRGLLFLEIEMADMIHCLDPNLLLLWVSRWWRPPVIKSLQLLVI